VVFGDETCELNLKNYEDYARNLVGRLFGRCLRNRVLSVCAMRITTRSFGRALRRALY
jgi:hypothetical protein